MIPERSALVDFTRPYAAFRDALVLRADRAVSDPDRMSGYRLAVIEGSANLKFARTFPDSQTDRNLLSRAVRRGGVERVRRGLYVSRTGQFSHSEASPLDIAAAVAPDAPPGDYRLLVGVYDSATGERRAVSAGS